VKTKASNEMIHRHIDAARERVREILNGPTADDITVIRRVRVTFPYKFVYLLGAACVLLKDFPEARAMLEDNEIDEIVNDHPGMAINFARSAGATPTWDDELYMEPAVAKIREALVAPTRAKYSIAVLATLETTSQDFIPNMEARAKRLGSKNLEFTQVHGVADERHAMELCQAASIVYGAEKSLDEATLVQGIGDGVGLIERIYTPLN